MYNDVVTRQLRSDFISMKVLELPFPLQSLNLFYFTRLISNTELITRYWWPTEPFSLSSLDRQLSDFMTICCKHLSEPAQKSEPFGRIPLQRPTFSIDIFIHNIPSGCFSKVILVLLIVLMSVILIRLRFICLRT